MHPIFSSISLILTLGILKHACPTCPTIYNWMPCTRLENQIRILTCNETNYTRTDLIFWVCMALRNQLKLLRRLSLKYSLKLCCKIIRHPFRNSYHRSVFIHCSQFYNNTANYGRPLILLKTQVVLVRVAPTYHALLLLQCHPSYNTTHTSHLRTSLPG